MSLNKTDSAKLQALQDNVGLLIKVANLAPEAAFAGIAEKAAEFEAQTQHKVLLLSAPDADGNWLAAVDLRRDFLRLRQVGDGYNILKARALGVSVDVKVARAGAYAHSNQRLADALEKLAASIRLQPVLAELGHADLAYVPGEVVEVAEDDEELAEEGVAAEASATSEAAETVETPAPEAPVSEADPVAEAAPVAEVAAEPVVAATAGRSLFDEPRPNPSSF